MTRNTDTRLEIRRMISASPERLFAAWTTPEHLLNWWGPTGVTCTLAEISLEVGGRYRLGNELAGGRVIYISGEFLTVAPPNKLVYTWSIEGDKLQPETVTVLFNKHGDKTEVVITHEQIQDAARREEHATGWGGCLDGLVAFVSDID